MGIKVEEVGGIIDCNSEKIIGNKITLDFPSVGATENAILASVLSDGKTEIINAAMEPEIVDLQNFLNKMGAKIKGAGTNIVLIEGVKKLKDAGYKIMPDRIEAGTLLCAVAATGGKKKLKEVCPSHLSPVLNKLEECGCEINIEKNIINLNASRKLKGIDIKTMPYPGFPTDLQSIFGAMLASSKGTSIIIENIFENRFKYLNELKRMGAKVTIEGRSCIIKGVKKLTGAKVKATDLRGGAALVIAALSAKGKTTIENIDYILRGYENLDKKINSLGGNIKILEE